MERKSALRIVARHLDIGMEFPTEHALKTYLEKHPGADKSNHSVADHPDKGFRPHRPVPEQEKLLVEEYGRGKFHHDAVEVAHEMLDLYKARSSPATKDWLRTNSSRVKRVLRDIAGDLAEEVTEEVVKDFAKKRKEPPSEGSTPKRPASYVDQYLMSPEWEKRWKKTFSFQEVQNVVHTMMEADQRNQH
jgi:hypothetical protein